MKSPVKSLLLALLSVPMLLFPQPAMALISYAEGADLTGNLAIPDNLGSVSVGSNTVSGTVDMVCENGFCDGPFSDSADSFEFTVPEGLRVATYEVIITSYASTTLGGEGARIRSFTNSFSSEPNFQSDVTYSNLAPVPDGIPAGLHDFQVTTIPHFNESTFDEEGEISYSWVVNMTVEPVGPAPVPALSAVARLWLFVSIVAGGSTVLFRRGLRMS